MKTEVTLNDALAAKLLDAAAASQLTFNQALEQAVNAGLPFMPRQAAPQPYRVKPHHFGVALNDPKSVLAAMDEHYDLQKARGPG